MSDELKPCPFCGEMPIVHTREEGIISVECSTRRGCVNSAGWSTPEQWNLRPIEDALRAENERLREALREIKMRSLETYADYEMSDVAYSMRDTAYEALKEVK